MPIPPGGPVNPNPPSGGSAWDAAREAMTAAQSGGAIDLIGIAQKFGVAVEHVITAMSQLTVAEGRAAREVGQLQARASFARTQEGQGRMAEAAGYRAQLAEARRAAMEPTGPPRAVFQRAEREDREAAAARRYAAGIGEREEAKAARTTEREQSRAARADEREDREAAAARRAGARVREQEEAKAARDTARGQARAAREAERAEKATPEYRARAAAESLAAQAAYARTPEGRESLAAQARLRRELAAAKKEAEGPPPSFAERLAEKPRALGYAAAAGVVAFHRIARTAEAGDPSAYSTFEASQELIKAKVGGDVAPGLNVLSSALQDVAAGYESLPKSGRVGFWSGALGASGMKPDLQNLAIPGVQGGVITSPEDIWNRAQAAALNPNDVDTAILAEQMKNLAESMGRLETRIAEGNDQGIPNWRRK